MGLNLKYTTERRVAEMNAHTYVESFRNADYFIQFCKLCGNFGRRHGCPPFEYDPLSIIMKYNKVRIIGVKILPEDKSLPLERANDLMKDVIAAMNRELLETEQQKSGLGLGFVGPCPYCNGEPCARISGEPCRHPEQVRPSLEAYGFDVGKTAKDLLGIEIRWSQGGLIPEYLTLVCGVFYQEQE